MKSERFILRLKVNKWVWLFCSSVLNLFLNCAKINIWVSKLSNRLQKLLLSSRPWKCYSWWPLGIFACLQHSRCFSLFQEVIHPSTEASSGLCHYRILLPIWRPIGLGSWFQKQRIKVLRRLIWRHLCQRNVKRLSTSRCCFLQLKKINIG